MDANQKLPFDLLLHTGTPSLLTYLAQHGCSLCECLAHMLQHDDMICSAVYGHKQSGASQTRTDTAD